MSRTVQLRRYNLKPHLVDDFLAWWPALLVPARAAYGFTVERNVALAMIPATLPEGAEVAVDVMGELVAAVVAKDSLA